MHILYHHRTDGEGVEGVHIMGMVRALRRLGHSVEVSSPPGCDPEGEETGGPARGPIRGGRLRMRLKRFARTAPPLLFELAEVAYNLYSLLDMLRRVCSRTPDLIYERTTSNSLAPTILAECCHIPIVQEVNVTAEIGRFRPLVLRRLAKRTERWISRQAVLVVTVSKTFGHMLVQAGWTGNRIVTCPNAVDPEQFDLRQIKPAERPARIRQGAFVIGYVGSFLLYHRLDMLVEVARRLASDYAQVGWLLVGDGVERPRVDTLLAKLGLREKFWMPGQVPHCCVPSYIMAMDAAVMPNSETFNSPMKLFEYMAMGKAVIAPRVSAVEEVVRHEETGLLFEPGKIDSLCEALERVISDAELRQSVGRNAREYVMRHHTWMKNAQRMLTALDNRLGRYAVNNR